MTYKETALKTITKLVERFEEQYKSYKDQSYNETLTRRDFIDPFFKALGWDMDNENGYAEAYREVIHEDKVKISGSMKAPDYSFRLSGGKRLFFVEAKKPSVDVKDEVQPSYQVRRYGWSAKLPISIITDFEEFSVYDCTKKPSPNDSSSVTRTNYLTFKDYIKEFDFIWDTFSKEKVLKGSFDKFIQGTKGKKGTATVDKEFLISLDKWRTYLAKAISKDNKNLNEDEINFAVQQFIDRIIFLRIAEDRNVEPYGSLKHTFSENGDVYQNLFKLFRTADEKYNSGIFDFKKDRISESLTLDNKVIKKIISELYYPESPYEFSVLSVEILGSAYEQFLGKQIKISDSHRVTIEDKPEVRKAGGVYYTPQYIVEYIVNNTVGKLIENKTPNDISKIKVVDPACGSGSFLLGAYQCLLDYHKDFYSDKGKMKTAGKENVLTPEGNLSTAEKKRILTNNIFGVDIDTNATEVTKLSLLLKCMEGETDASIATQTKLWNERVLPNIDNNIKSGNSLIDTDFYDGEIDFGDEKKIKPFNWQKAFPEVFAQGGFDAVIGNPPYLKLTKNNIETDILKYYKNKYYSFSGGSSKNLFQLFLEKVSNLSPKYFSFIVPEAMLTTESNGKIRSIILEIFNINSIVIFDHFVFEDATIGTTIIVGEKNQKSATKIVKIDTSNNQTLFQELKLENGLLPWDVSLSKVSKNIFGKIIDSSILMGELVEMSKGMVVRNRNDVLTENPMKNSLPFLLGNCMGRYEYKYNKFAVYKNLEIIGGTRNLSKHLSTPRLLIRRTGRNLCATYSDKSELIESTIYILRSDKIDLKLLLGIINSKFLSFYLSKKLITNTQGFPQVLMGQLDQLPIKIGDEKDQEKIIHLVDQLLILNQEKQTTKLQTQLEQIQTRIEYCEDKIDQAVYELYGLTEEEIRVVEGKKLVS